MASLSNAVLVVDDEKSVTDVLSLLLKRHALQVEIAATASDGIRLLLDNSYGCLMVDKNLADMKKRDELLVRQQSDLELLQQVIEEKVKEATQELQEKCRKLDEELRSLKTPAEIP